MAGDYNVNLKERHLREENFHDQKADKASKDGFYEHGASSYSYEKMLSLAGEFKNKNVLDLGCGTGWASVIYAERGSKVTAIDISEIVIMKSPSPTKATTLRSGFPISIDPSFAPIAAGTLYPIVEKPPAVRHVLGS